MTKSEIEEQRSSLLIMTQRHLNEFIPIREGHLLTEGFTLFEQKIEKSMKNGGKTDKNGHYYRFIHFVYSENRIFREIADNWAA